MNSPPWDTIVIGAGAAGMMAAYGSATRGRRTLLLEKNRKLGVKILISGGTRCNLTHDATAREIAAAFPKPQRRFLGSALATLPPNVCWNSFTRLELPPRSKRRARSFPHRIEPSTYATHWSGESATSAWTSAATFQFWALSVRPPGLLAGTPMAVLPAVL